MMDDAGGALRVTRAFILSQALRSLGIAAHGSRQAQGLSMRRAGTGRL